jgi:hypothetical protein
LAGLSWLKEILGIVIEDHYLLLQHVAAPTLVALLVRVASEAALAGSGYLFEEALGKILKLFGC